MKLISAVKGLCFCWSVWAVSVLFFACLQNWWPDLDVMAGAWAMTAMFAVCALTAVAVKGADKSNL